MLIIVSQEMQRVTLNTYHVSGVGGHLGIIETLVVLRLYFVWPDMRKDSISWPELVQHLSKLRVLHLPADNCFICGR